MKKILLILVCFVFLTNNVHGETNKSYKRIVSLSPSTTEILFALGVGISVVGVTNFCDWPSEVKDIKKIGGMTNPSLELVVSAEPDLVILTHDGNPPEFLKRLKDLNINTYTFKAKRFSELGGEINRLASKLGVQESGVILSKSINQSIQEFSKIKKYKDLKALYIVWPDPLIVAGPNTAIDDAMRLIGLNNLASDSITQYPRFSIEEVLLRDPQVVFIGNHSITRAPGEKLLNKISSMSAVKEGRVFFIGDSLHRLGPRTTDGIKELVDSLKGVEMKDK